MNSKSQCTSHESALQRAFRELSGTLWTGRGASYAVASAIATTLRRSGRESQALPPEELDGRSVCVVSRSGNPPCSSVAFLISESRGQNTSPEMSLEVPDCQSPLECWLPLDWVEAASRATAAHLGSHFEVQNQFPDSAGRSTIVLVPQDAEPLVKLLAAVQAKVGGLGLAVTSWGELGHGWHAQLADQPARWRAIELLAAGETSPPALKAWRDKHALGTAWHSSIIIAAESWVSPLARLAAFARIIGAVMVEAGIDYQKSKCCPEADWLRSAL